MKFFKLLFLLFLCTPLTAREPVGLVELWRNKIIKTFQLPDLKKHRQEQKAAPVQQKSPKENDSDDNLDDPDLFKTATTQKALQRATRMAEGVAAQPAKGADKVRQFFADFGTHAQLRWYRMRNFLKLREPRDKSYDSAYDFDVVENHDDIKKKYQEFKDKLFEDQQSGKIDMPKFDQRLKSLEYQRQKVVENVEQRPERNRRAVEREGMRLAQGGQSASTLSGRDIALVGS